MGEHKSDNDLASESDYSSECTKEAPSTVLDLTINPDKLNEFARVLVSDIKEKIQAGTTNRQKLINTAWDTIENNKDLLLSTIYINKEEITNIQDRMCKEFKRAVRNIKNTSGKKDVSLPAIVDTIKNSDTKNTEEEVQTISEHLKIIILQLNPYILTGYVNVMFLEDYYPKLKLAGIVFLLAVLILVVVCNV
ncbi:hypothetical protein NERG_00968 [Nematocida ausubeli]|uniref:Uncharacterized protein n=1 Tax=Nematocida ausubeli (strain ATCC PRA-371 / ERTm2) TaxID=1913371 RepID=H8ZBL9_NEMA1|nr:hypothetical protein NERG_00968 [Nematocida ausubeli]